MSSELRETVERVSKMGGTPLVVAEGNRALGVIYLKDIVKGGIKERFFELRRMGIRTVMITGDNPLTATAIAAEAGVDDFLAEATPEAKLKMIHSGRNDLAALLGQHLSNTISQWIQNTEELLRKLSGSPTEAETLFALVHDLLANAQRRIREGRYDDRRPARPDFKRMLEEANRDGA